MTRDDLERLGGPAGVHRILDAFVRRAASDFIIGFFFQGRDLERIARHEAELVIERFGGGPAYRGRPLDRVHRPLRINRGHFRRRLAILQRVLEEHGVPEDIARRWIEEERSLAPLVTNDQDCTGPAREEP